VGEEFARIPRGIAIDKFKARFGRVFLFCSLLFSHLVFMSCNLD